MKIKLILFLKLFLLISTVLTQPYYFDGLISSPYNDYDGTNPSMNHIGNNYELDSTDANIPFGGFYFKNIISEPEAIIVDKVNGITFVAIAPTV